MKIFTGYLKFLLTIVIFMTAVARADYSEDRQNKELKINMPILQKNFTPK